MDDDTAPISLLDQIKNELVKYHRLTRAKERTVQIDEDIKSKKAQRQRLIDQLNDSYGDDDAFEGFNLKSLVHRLLGIKQKKLDELRENNLRHIDSLKQLTRSIKLLEFEKQVLCRKLRAIKRTRIRLDELKGQRAMMLRNQHSNLGKRLRLLDTRFYQLYVQQSDLEEAADQGNKLLQLVAKLLDMLKHDEFSNSNDNKKADHNHMATLIDEFKGQSNKLSMYIEAFNRELQDTSVYRQATVIKYPYEQMELFSQLQFFLAIAEPIRQQRVSNTRDVLNSIHSDVERTLQRIERRRHQVQEKVNSARLEYDAILEDRPWL